jgi:hypothetical protein
VAEAGTDLVDDAIGAVGVRNIGLVERELARPACVETADTHAEEAYSTVDGHLCEEA